MFVIKQLVCGDSSKLSKTDFSAVNAFDHFCRKTQLLTDACNPTALFKQKSSKITFTDVLHLKLQNTL